MFFRIFPSYEDRLKSLDRRHQLLWYQKLFPFFLFMLFNFLCLLASVWYRLKSPHAAQLAGEDFSKYFGTFGYWYLTGAWHKAMEGVHFSQIDLVAPSIEVGLCRGNISALHFQGKVFDFGSEYLYFEIKKSAETYQKWNNVYSDNLTQCALNDNSVSTICAVHVIDHIEPIDSVILELSRVLKDGGKIYFSGFSDYHFRYSLIWQAINIVSRKLADRFAQFLAKRRGSYNLWSPAEWEKILSRHGLKLASYTYTESGFYGFLVYFLHFVCAANFCFEFDFLKKGRFRLVLEKLFRYYYFAIGAPQYLQTKNKVCLRGDNFFAVAEKKRVKIKN